MMFSVPPKKENSFIGKHEKVKSAVLRQLLYLYFSKETDASY